MTAIEDFKKDIKTITTLREEDMKLEWKQTNKLHELKSDILTYRVQSKIKIINQYSGKEAEVAPTWIESHGTEEQREEVRSTIQKMKDDHIAEERNRRSEIRDEIKKIYKNYDQLFHGLENSYCEGNRYDGESDIVDLIQVAINTLEFMEVQKE